MVVYWRKRGQEEDEGGGFGYIYTGFNQMLAGDFKMVARLVTD